MKVFAIVTVARQVDGEIVTVRFEKAFTQFSKADEYAKGLAQITSETINVPDFGPTQFGCTRGIHEIEVEE